MFFRRTTEQRLAKLESIISDRYRSDWARGRAARKIGDIGGGRAPDILVRAVESTFKPEDVILVNVSPADYAERERRYRESQRSLRSYILGALVAADNGGKVLELLSKHLEGTLDLMSHGYTSGGLGYADVSESHIEAIRNGQSRGEIADALVGLLENSSAPFPDKLLESLAEMPNPSQRSYHPPPVQFGDPDITGWGTDEIDLSILREAAQREIDRRRSVLKTSEGSDEAG